MVLQFLEYSYFTFFFFHVRSSCHLISLFFGSFLFSSSFSVLFPLLNLPFSERFYWSILYPCLHLLISCYWPRIWEGLNINMFQQAILKEDFLIPITSQIRKFIKLSLPILTHISDYLSCQQQTCVISVDRYLRSTHCPIWTWTTVQMLGKLPTHLGSHVLWKKFVWALE